MKYYVYEYKFEFNEQRQKPKILTEPMLTLTEQCEMFNRRYKKSLKYAISATGISTPFLMKIILKMFIMTIEIDI